MKTLTIKIALIHTIYQILEWLCAYSYLVGYSNSYTPIWLLLNPIYRASVSVSVSISTYHIPTGTKPRIRNRNPIFVFPAACVWMDVQSVHVCRGSMDGPLIFDFWYERVRSNKQLCDFGIWIWIWIWEIERLIVYWSVGWFDLIELDWIELIWIWIWK